MTSDSPFSGRARLNSKSPAEEDKPAGERGVYLHPELYQALKEKGIDWARHPQIMQRRQAYREKATAATGKTIH